LTNYAAWPYYKKILEEQRARNVGICRFVDCPPPGVSAESLRAVESLPSTASESKRLTADALTKMREESTLNSDLRIVWAGKISGSSGWMAGILEEVSFSLKHNRPLLILGGFGGCAKLIADYLAQVDAEWPARLSLDACKDHERDELQSAEDRQELISRFAEVRADMQNYRSQLNMGTSIHSLPADLLNSALTERSPREAITLAVQAAKLVRDSQQSL
ncbi:MAG: hypothetical protein KDA85_02350, partial [Planctomycetaceae bacterium]|nr:hypothetical protein [Planctomycetaceae bacterium]